MLLPKEHKTTVLTRAVMAEPEIKEAQHKAVQVLSANPRIQILFVFWHASFTCTGHPGTRQSSSAMVLLLDVSVPRVAITLVKPTRTFLIWQ